MECIIENCTKPIRMPAYGLCNPCYQKIRRQGTLPIPTPPPTLEERFWTKVEKGLQEDCWLWTGAIITSGYGHLWLGGTQIRAHRLSWNLHFGEIPTDLWVLHKCDVRSCVNPNHLFLGTVSDNVRDMWKKGRGSKPPIAQSKAVETSLDLTQFLVSGYQSRTGDCAVPGCGRSIRSKSLCQAHYLRARKQVRFSSKH